MASLIRDLSAQSAEMIAIFGDAALVRAALDFEAALANAQSASGLLTQQQAAAIDEACAAFDIDVETLAGEAAHAGTLAIPLVQHLRARVAARDPSAAKAVHLGATSQDVADTALMLQAKAASTLIERELVRLAAALAILAERHRTTPMLGRTLLQSALPISFGLKAANWLVGIDNTLARFRREGEGALMLQFGGATGTLASLNGHAFAVAQHMATHLGLGCPLMPWHARREAVAGLGAALGIATGSVAKIARDISLLAQNEIGEAFEPKTEGRGGSSAMAHKRNPTGCQIALSAALRTPGLVGSLMSGLPQEHERGLGGWQTEAPVLAELFGLTHGALLAMTPVVEGLEVDTAAMARNLAAAHVGNDLGESGALVLRALDHHGKHN